VVRRHGAQANAAMPAERALLTYRGGGLVRFRNSRSIGSHFGSHLLRSPLFVLFDIRPESLM
jgi:hypothetical protein